MRKKHLEELITSLENKLEVCQAQKESNKALAEINKELLDTSIDELKFQELQIESLLNIIDEIHTVSQDEIVLAIIENAKNRFWLDKIIHTKISLKEINEK